MKKLFAFSLVAMFLFVSVAIAAPISSPGEGDILGAGKFASDPHRIFRLVRYFPATPTIDSPTITAESVVIWDTITDDGVTVTTTTTSSDSRIAGILATQALTPEGGNFTETAAQAIGKRNWAYLQTYGLATAKIAAGASGRLNVGSMFGTSSTACFIDAFTPDVGPTSKGTAGSTMTQWGSAGFAYDTPSAATSGTEVEVFLRGLD